jgi:glycosyltransferase involved in cell wall biosynthesis
MGSVDVVVPCYNYGRYLRQCVESVLEQEGVEVRVLIIDDCSTDDTPEVGRTLAAEDTRVEYRRHAHNLRHIATYNEGLLEWASADYSLLLSADDLLTVGSLGRAARVLDEHPEVGLVWGRQVVFEDTPPDVPHCDSWTHEIVSGHDFIERMCRSGSNPVTTPTAIVRTRVLHEVGGYNAKLPHTADMEYWMRIAARASVGILGAEQAFKRAHGQNMQVEFVTTVLPDLKQREEAFETFFARDGSRFGDCAELLQLARMSLASEAFWAASKAFDRGENAECDMLLKYARTLDAELPAKNCWRRLSWKRGLGSRTWRAVRPLVDRLRANSLSN